MLQQGPITIGLDQEAIIEQLQTVSKERLGLIVTEPWKLDLGNLRYNENCFFMLNPNIWNRYNGNQ